jgi:hypothetical protein
MSGNGSNPTAEEITSKESQERELKVTQVGDLTSKAPSRTPSNIESSDYSASNSDSDSDSSNEDVKDGDDPVKKVARKRIKAKKKKKAKKLAKKLLKKMIKKEQAKYTHSATMKCPTTTHNFRATTLTKSCIPCIWENLLISMGRTIPNGLMICKCIFTGFTPLFGRLWL